MPKGTPKIPKVRMEEAIAERILDIYALAKAGHSNMRIAELLDVSWNTFRKWMKRKHVMEALERGRKLDEEANNFKEYIYKQLDPELRYLWEEIMECEKAKSPVGRLEAKLEGLGRVGQQNLFIHALVHSAFNLSTALRLCHVSKRKLERWIKEDRRFAELIDEIDWHKKNFFEGALMLLVKKGHPGAVMFANRTINSDRGYSIKNVVEKNVNITGGTKNTTTVKIDDLDLPLEHRKAILAKYREKEQE